MFQSNFKKGIAYSTVAQLGYMFAGVGVGAPFAGLFHLLTHASFKALLFLAAGIVIHGAGGREALIDLRGLGRFFPFSRWGFLIGSLALIGTPLITAGSFSKDAIIDAAIATQPILGWLLLGGVLLTGLYIGRLFAIVYMAPANDPHTVHHDPPAERPMNWSLVPLMIGAVTLGWVGWIGWLPAALSGPLGGIEPLPPLLNLTGGLAFILGAVGFLASAWYAQRPQAAAAAADAGYRPDAWVRAIAEAGYAVAGGLSRAQSGLLARYAFGSIVAVAVILLVRVSLR
jgi:NADH-quinone oxidoreductase subunit L